MVAVVGVVDCKDDVTEVDVSVVDVLVEEGV